MKDTLLVQTCNIAYFVSWLCLDIFIVSLIFNIDSLHYLIVSLEMTAKTNRNMRFFNAS